MSNRAQLFADFDPTTGEPTLLKRDRATPATAQPGTGGAGGGYDDTNTAAALETKRLAGTLTKGVTYKESDTGLLKLATSTTTTQPIGGIVQPKTIAAATIAVSAVGFTTVFSQDVSLYRFLGLQIENTGANALDAAKLSIRAVAGMSMLPIFASSAADRTAEFYTAGDFLKRIDAQQDTVDLSQLPAAGILFLVFDVSEVETFELQLQALTATNNVLVGAILKG